MDITLSSEQSELQQRVHKFIATQIIPREQVWCSYRLHSAATTLE